MANPQLETGYTRISNELLDAIIRVGLSGAESKVFWLIVRKTYGFRKKDDEISLSQFCLATGMNKQNVCRSLSNLIKKNMIIKSDKGKITKYRIQKDYTAWLPLSKLITLSNLIKPVIKSDKEIVINSETHKRNKNTKETTTKEEKRVPSMQKPRSGPPIGLNFETGSWENIPAVKMKRWGETYPACDIVSELARMADWLIENPTKRKKNYGAFISRWLSRQQEKGGTRGTPKTAALGSWVKSRAAEREKNNVK